MGELIKGIREWWPVIAFFSTLAGWCGREMFMYFKKMKDDHDILEKRVTAAEQDHQSHEELCGQRYDEIKNQFDQIKDRGNERHQENKTRLDLIAEGLEDVRRILMSGEGG